jgi:hypothetical protein
MSALRRDGSLARDEKGAMMLSAVFLAGFLVGVLWYLIGVGDAIVYRETMQDGADATAFGAAVYHARGMNVIAELNIIMAAVLAVLVALKIAQVIVVSLNIGSCAACASIVASAVACPICAATSAAEEPLESAIENAQNVVDDVLTGLSAAQKAIAYGMPWVAEIKAVASANDHAPTVHGGFALSTSMVPGVDVGSGGSSSSSVSFASASSGGSGGSREGLPVQEDDFSVLCDHAGRDVAGLVLLPFPSVIKDAGESMVGGLVSSMAPYFCGDGTDRTSKRVYDPAHNGDDYFAVWSLVWGDLSSQSGAARGVETGAWNQLHAKPPSDLTKIGFAKAEFYYDVRPDGGSPAKWDDYKDDAMWNLRWRARMRRVRPPGSAIASVLSSAVGSEAGSYASSWIGAASEASSALGFAGSWGSSLGSAVGSAEGTIGSAEQAAQFFTVVH